MAGQTPLGNWITRTFTPASKIAKGMANPPGAKGSPNASNATGSLTPEEIAERKRRLMAAGQGGSSLGNSVMSLFGLSSK